MEKTGTYKIIYERPLNIEYYRGIITVEDLIHFKNVIRREPNYDLYSNTITDLRDCILLVKKEELNKIVDFLKTNFEKKGVRNIVYLTSKPNEAILATFYSFLTKDSKLNFNPDICSSEKAAVKMFSKEIITEEELKEILNELRTSHNNVFAKQVH